MKPLHIHLDPVGGVAGDMFIAAVLDAFPALEEGLLASIRAAGLPPDIEIEFDAHRDHALTGRRFAIVEDAQGGASGHHHRTFSDIRHHLQTSCLAEDVCAQAVAMFTLLARAEAQVHGMTINEVSFHELGEWDSIADIIGAAFLACELNATWSVGPLPLGRGGVATAHGSLPVPAPATALLLEGFDCFDDGISGERVTPTGAAILRHLGANRTRDSIHRRLVAGGTGFGTRKLPGLSNVLRLLVFEEVVAPTPVQDRIAEILFEVDDQTPEDLAIGLDRLRDHQAVRDVLQIPAFGKKGRMTTHVRVLADPEQLADICQACMDETTTIGLRYQVLDRYTLQRRESVVNVDGNSVRVKASRRADSETIKAEADDIARLSGGLGSRDGLRRRVQAAFTQEDDGGND